VLSLIAEGRSNGRCGRGAADHGGAVERHATSIFDKLGMRQLPEHHRRVLALLTYLRA